MLQTTKLYLGENCRYPLKLTKSLLLYVAGSKLVSGIDWNRSTRYYLIVKKSIAPKIMKLKFFYPDGELFGVKTEEDLLIMEAEPEEPYSLDFWPDEP